MQQTSSKTWPVTMLNSIYLQVQHVVWVRPLSPLAGPPRCCCTELSPRFPPSWRATAASCFSTSLQQKHNEYTHTVHTCQPVLQTDYIPVRSQWGRSYVPSELFFLRREKNKVKLKFLKGFCFPCVIMRIHTCSSSATHKPQSRWEQSEPWPTRALELLPAPHLRAKILQ